MKTWKKIAWISVVLIVASGVVFYFTRSKTETFAWKTQRIQEGNIIVSVTATGPVNPLQTVQVGTQVTGTIAKLFVDFNSIVRKGQLIALIDTTLLSASEQDAKAASQRAEIQLAEMKKEFERAEALIKNNAISQADYDVANSNYLAAISTAASLRAQLRRARINLKYAAIYAPINGVVISRNVDAGQTVVSSFNTPTLFSIANDLSKMEVYANVDEADIGQVRAGQKVIFTVDAYPDETFTGEVEQVRLQPSIVQNVVNYTVLISVSNPGLRLLPGLTANVNIQVNEHDSVLKVPANALHFYPPASYLGSAALPDSIRLQIAALRDDVKHIWIRRGAFITPAEVTTGLSDGNYVEIKGRVHPDEEVVVGIDNSQAEKTAPNRNPFMPSFQRPRRM